MIITCPSCSARYPVDAGAFAPSGRKVRCAKCGNTWHQAPASDLGGSAEPSSEAASPSALDKVADTVIPFKASVNQKPLFNSGAVKVTPTKPVEAPKSDATAKVGITVPDDIFSEDDDIAFADEAPADASSAKSPAKPYAAAGTQAGAGSKLRGYLNDVATMRRGRVFGAIGWVLLIAFVAGSVYGVVEYRRQIATVWPSTIKLYAAAGAPINLIGFELAQVSYERQDENGLPVLAIKGVVVNVSGETKAVPRLRVGLFDTQQRELYHWTFALKESELKPDQKVPFVTRLSSPPAGARDLEVRFVNPGEDLPVASIAPQAAVPAASAGQTLAAPAQSSDPAQASGPARASDDASSEHHP